MKLDVDNLGPFIRKKRIEQGMTQKELANYCGIHPVTLQKIELGKIFSPKFSTILDIFDGLDLKMLGVDIDYKEDSWE